MTVMMDTILILLGIVFLLLIAFLIPCVLQITRIAKDMALTLRIVNKNLPVTMKNLEEITTRVNQTTATLHRQFEEFLPIVEKIKEMMVLLVGLEEIIRRRAHIPFVPTMRSCLAVSKGVRVFLSHLLSRRPSGG